MTDLELAEEIGKACTEARADMFVSWLLERLIQAPFSRPKVRQDATTALAALRRGPERLPSSEMVMVPREPYWMIERGSPAEWWVRGMPEVWTIDSAKAQHFTEWGAKTHAKELESWGVKGPLRATEHLDCDGTLPAAEAEGRKG